MEDYAKHISASVERLISQEFDGKLTHQGHDGEPYPSRGALIGLVETCREVLFPGFFGNAHVNKTTLPYRLGVGMEQLFHVLEEQLFASLCFECDSEERQLASKRAEAVRIATAFIDALPSLKATLRTDVQAIFEGDPAAKNFGEIILAYPGLRAIVNYRIAHKLLQLGANIIVPRMITEQAHSETGIDIHPGATIGDYFAIDHGTGIVIGETCILGDHVKLYQGVTLGAKSFPTDENNAIIKGIARHPILEDGVVVYAGATILGRITIGKNAVIGGNTWVTEPVPAGETVFNR